MDDLWKVVAELAMASAKRLMEKPALKSFEPQMSDNLRPERVAAEAAIIIGSWDEAKQYYQMFAQGSTSDPLLNYTIDEIDIIRLEREGDLEGALAKAESMRATYTLQTSDQRLQQAAMQLENKIAELRGKLGLDQEGPMTFSLGQ